MTKTLAQLITIVRFRGDMRNTIRFPDANITGELQAAFAEWYELVDEVNEGFFDTTSTTPTIANTAFAVLPSGTWNVKAIDRLDGSDYIPVPRVGVKDRNRFGSTTGRPTCHRLTARGIDLYPTPDAVYTLRVTYTPVAPTLSTTGLEYYNSWEEYAIFGALVRLYKNQGRDASDWEKDLNKQAARINTAAARRNVSGPEYLNLRDGFGDDSFDDVDRWRPGY